MFEGRNDAVIVGDSWCCALLGRVQLLATPWTVTCRVPLSMEFFSKKMGVGCHFLFQGIFLTQELNPHFLHWQVNSLPTAATEKMLIIAK